MTTRAIIEAIRSGKVDVRSTHEKVVAHLRASPPPLSIADRLNGLGRAVPFTSPKGDVQG